MSRIHKLCREAGYKNHESYLKSDHWIRLRDKLLKERCFCCGSGKALQLHHVTYERFGREEPGDLVTVCSKCHCKIHSETKKGTGLDKAHFVVKKRCLKSSGRRMKNGRKLWVSNWRKLIGDGSKMTITELEEMLTKYGHMHRIGNSPPEATDKAFHFGMCRYNYDKNTQEWNTKQFSLLKSKVRRGKIKPIKGYQSQTDTTAGEIND